MDELFECDACRKRRAAYQPWWLGLSCRHAEKRSSRT